MIFKLGPKASITFIIVVKAPLQKQIDMLSYLNITHIEDGDADAFAKRRTEKRVGKNG